MYSPLKNEKEVIIIGHSNILIILFSNKNWINQLMIDLLFGSINQNDFSTQNLTNPQT